MPRPPGPPRSPAPERRHGRPPPPEAHPPTSRAPGRNAMSDRTTTTEPLGEPAAEFVQLDPATLLTDHNIRAVRAADAFRQLVAPSASTGSSSRFVATRDHQGIRVRYGHRRVLAAVRAGREIVPVVVYTGTLTRRHRRRGRPHPRPARREHSPRKRPVGLDHRRVRATRRSRRVHGPNRPPLKTPPRKTVNEASPPPPPRSRPRPPSGGTSSPSTTPPTSRVSEAPRGVRYMGVQVCCSKWVHVRGPSARNCQSGCRFTYS
jgi:hypothetical protein